jgi:hypothetical protein
VETLRKLWFGFADPSIGGWEAETFTDPDGTPIAET